MELKHFLQSPAFQEICTCVKLVVTMRKTVQIWGKQDKESVFVHVLQSMKIWHFEKYILEFHWQKVNKQDINDHGWKEFFFCGSEGRWRGGVIIFVCLFLSKNIYRVYLKIYLYLKIYIGCLWKYIQSVSENIYRVYLKIYTGCI